MENAKKLDGYDGIFAQRFRLLMKQTNTTQARLAKDLQVSRQAVSTYMDGSVLPNMQNFQKICSFFNVSSDYLLGFSTSERPDINERAISDFVELNYGAISRLKDYKKDDENIITIVDTLLMSSKPLKQLSDTFSKRFKADYELNEITRRRQQLSKECTAKGKSLSTCEEAMLLYDKREKCQIEARWLKFLTAEYFDVIYSAYYGVILDKVWREKENEKHGKKD